MPTAPRSTRGECVSNSRKCLVRHGAVVNTTCWASAACEQWQPESMASSSGTPVSSSSSSLDLLSNAHAVFGDTTLSSAAASPANASISLWNPPVAVGSTDGAANTHKVDSAASEVAPTESLELPPTSLEIHHVIHQASPSLGERDMEQPEDHSDASSVEDNVGTLGSSSSDSGNPDASSSGGSTDKITPMLRGSAAAVPPQSAPQEPLYQPPPPLPLPAAVPALAQLPLRDYALEVPGAGAAITDDNAAREATADETAKNLDDEVCVCDMCAAKVPLYAL